MKKHTRKYYQQLYQGEKGAILPGLTGKNLAWELGYPPALLDSLSDEAWEDFLPCGNVPAYLNPKAGERVLNLGCGAGIDSIVLELRAGAGLEIVNLDTAFRALVKARELARGYFSGAGFGSVCADGDSLPFEQASFDWVILNGVFNLFPEKGDLVEELHRVLKRGGVAAGADLCRISTLPDYFASEPDAWAWCMSGALSRDELSAAFESTGFTKLDLVRENMDEYFDRVVFVFKKTG